MNGVPTDGTSGASLPECIFEADARLMSAKNHRSLHNQRLHFRLGLEFRFYTSRRHGWQRNRINGRRLGTARPFPLWRLHSGPQSWSVDQYSETPPEDLASTVAEATRRSVVTHHRRRIKNLSFILRLSGEPNGDRTL